MKKRLKGLLAFWLAAVILATPALAVKYPANVYTGTTPLEVNMEVSYNDYKKVNDFVIGTPLNEQETITNITDGVSISGKDLVGWKVWSEACGNVRNPSAAKPVDGVVTQAEYEARADIYEPLFIEPLWGKYRFSQQPTAGNNYTVGVQEYKEISEGSGVYEWGDPTTSHTYQWYEQKTYDVVLSDSPSSTQIGATNTFTDRFENTYTSTYADGKWMDDGGFLFRIALNAGDVLELRPDSPPRYGEFIIFDEDRNEYEATQSGGVYTVTVPADGEYVAEGWNYRDPLSPVAAAVIRRTASGGTAASLTAPTTGDYFCEVTFDGADTLTSNTVTLAETLTLYFRDGSKGWGLYAGDETEKYPGEGDTWTAEEGKLTLNGFHFTTTADAALSIEGSAEIVLNGSNTIKSVYSGDQDSYGVFAAGDNLTISGSGSLAVEGGTLNTEGATQKGSYGICADGINITGGTVNAKGGTVNATDVVATSSHGISAADININGGMVSAEGGTVNAEHGTGADSCGFSGTHVNIIGGTVNAKGGTVNATDVVGTSSYGISAADINITDGLITADYDGRGAAVSGTFLFIGSAGKPARLTNATDDRGNVITESSGDEIEGNRLLRIAAAPVVIDAREYRTLFLLEYGLYIGSDETSATAYPDDGTWSFADSKLTLSGLSFTTTAATALWLPVAAEIELAAGSENTLVSAYNGDDKTQGIYAAGALTISGRGSLTAVGGRTTNESYGIYGESDVTISGGTVTADYYDRANYSAAVSAAYEETLTVGSEEKPAVLTNAQYVNEQYERQDITESTGAVNEGLLFKKDSASPMVISFPDTRTLYFGEITTGSYGLYTEVGNDKEEYDGRDTTWTAAVPVGGEPAKLTLTDFSFTTTAAKALVLTADAEIVLAEGSENTVKSICADGRESRGIDTEYVLTISGTGSLNATGGTVTSSSSHGIRSEKIITISGGTVNAKGGAATNYSCGIHTDGGISITGGEVTADYDATANSFAAVKGGTSLTVGSTDKPARLINASDGTSPITTGTGVIDSGKLVRNSGTDPVVISFPEATTYTVTNTLTNITSDGAATATQNTQYTATLTAATGYTLPTSIIVKVGGTELTAGDDYTYASGVVTIKAAKVTGNIEIIADGAAINYTVTYNTDGGTTISPGSYTIETISYALPTAPKSSGYGFRGWKVTIGAAGGRGFAANTVFPANAATVDLDKSYGNVTLTAQWTPIIDPDPPGGGGGGTPTKPPVTPPVTEPWVNPFTDVSEGDWWYDAVAYCNENGLMDGVSATEYKPEGVVTRAEVWQVLANLAGVESDTTKAPWYGDAQAWAMGIGITDGTNPTGTVTREQLVTMLYRYFALIAKGKFEGGMSAQEYDDYEDVSDWAELAVQWGVTDGIIEGVGGNMLNPDGDATRAELATMLMRFDKLMKK